MPGPRGQVPKRSDQRRRRNLDGQPEKITQIGTVLIPPLRDELHPLAVRWYESLATSGQARFFEPSDWAMALLGAEVMDEFLTSRKASLLPPLMALCSSLLATEGDRRRMRLEIQRAAAETGTPEQTPADAFRARLGVA
jgi:hypothetical protein